MASSLTLTTLRDRVEAALHDSGNATWSTDDLDEAIRTALHEYSANLPYETIGTVTLSAAGREVDISSLSGYLTVERVWWDYDSTDPAYPPHWRDFELWPGDVLFIKDSDEPDSGDVVRVWYTKRHTLKDLDSATATTFSERDESLIVVGACAYAALQRAVEVSEDLTVDGWVHQRLRTWGEERMEEFQAGIADRVAQEAARASGIAPTADLDRWDEDGTEWW